MKMPIKPKGMTMETLTGPQALGAVEDDSPRLEAALSAAGVCGATVACAAAAGVGVGRGRPAALAIPAAHALGGWARARAPCAPRSLRSLCASPNHAQTARIFAFRR